MNIPQDQIDQWADSLGHRSDRAVFTEIAKFGAKQASVKARRIVALYPLPATSIPAEGRNSFSCWKPVIYALDDQGNAWATYELGGQGPMAFEDWVPLPELPQEL